MNVEQTVVTITIPGSVDVGALDLAIASVASGAKLDVVQVYTRAVDDEALVSSFAEAIAALPAHLWQILRILMSGSDSLTLSQGDARFSIRPDLIAASRRLKNVLSVDDPIGMILSRRKEHFSDGSYKGLSYSATPFGRKVLKKLKEMGS